MLFRCDNKIIIIYKINYNKDNSHSILLYMKKILDIFIRNIPTKLDFSKSRTMHLGRWNIHDNNEKALQKADMTNEDHCGVCDKMREEYLQKEPTKSPYTHRAK